MTAESAKAIAGELKEKDIFFYKFLQINQINAKINLSHTLFNTLGWTFT